MNIQLGANGTYKVETPTSYVGAVYSGLVVGVTSGGKVVKPLAERWPDARGNFSMTLPASVRGKTLPFWENQRQFFSRFTAEAWTNCCSSSRSSGPASRCKACRQTVWLKKTGGCSTW